MEVPDTGPTAHAILGASSADRWMNCPGSVQLAESLPEQDTTTKYAAEGTVAHAAGYLSLRMGVDPVMYVGKKIDGMKVTMEMALAVGVYVDKVNTLSKSSNAEPKLEVQFSLERLNPKEPMFGTADCVIWDELTAHLHVLDYKHGQGVVVEAVDNVQLQYYALGAVLELKVKPRQVTVWIIQPRAPHRDGTVRDWTFGWDHLIEYRHELMTAAYRTREDGAPLVIGDHCRFCPASAVCPAQREHAMLVVQDAFTAEVETPDLPEPEMLTEAELGTVMDHSDHIMDWLRSVQTYVRKEKEAGHPGLPGWKLIEKRANRKWTNEVTAKQELRGMGFLVRDITEKKLVSPAKVEVLLRREGKDIPAGLVKRESSGYNLVPASDPRPEAVPTQIEEVFNADSDES